MRTSLLGFLGSRVLKRLVASTPKQRVDRLLELVSQEAAAVKRGTYHLNSPAWETAYLGLIRKRVNQYAQEVGEKIGWVN